MDKLDLVQKYIECRLVEYGLVDDGKDDYTTACLVSALRIYQDLLIEDPHHACDRVKRLQIIFTDYMKKRFRKDGLNGPSARVWFVIDSNLDGHAESLYETTVAENRVGVVKATLYNVRGDGSCFFQAISHSILRQERADATHKHIQGSDTYGTMGIIQQYKMDGLCGMRKIYKQRMQSHLKNSRWKELRLSVRNDFMSLPEEIRESYNKTNDFQKLLTSLGRDKDYMHQGREVYAFEMMGIAKHHNMDIYQYVVTCNGRFQPVNQEYQAIKDTNPPRYHNPKDPYEKYKWQRSEGGELLYDSRGKMIHEKIIIPNFRYPGELFEVQFARKFCSAKRGSLAPLSVYLVSVGMADTVCKTESLKYRVNTSHWGLLEFSDGVKPIDVPCKPFTIRRSKEESLALLRARMPTPTI